MSAATLTSKGQVTIPKRIRERLRLNAGDRVTFRELPDGRVVLEPETVDLRELRGLVKTHVRGVTVEDMNSAVRDMGSRRAGP